MNTGSWIDIIFVGSLLLAFFVVAYSLASGKSVGTVIGTALGWVMSFVGGVLLPKKTRRRLYKRLRICQKKIEGRNP